MEISLHLGGEAAFRLTHALLVYGDGHRAFATVHVPIAGPNGAPTLAPGSPVGAAFLRALGDGLGAGLPLEILPDTVLCRTPDVTVWWRPRRRASLFWNLAANAKQKKPLEAISGKTSAQPALVFKATRDSLWVRAMRGDTRPSEATALYQAPYFNVDVSGHVCLGSMRTPASRGVGALKEWERGFFESEFTHPVGAGRLMSYDGGFVKLWSTLVRQKNGVFPDRALIRAPKGDGSNETLGSFVAASIDEDR